SGSESRCRPCRAPRESSPSHLLEARNKARPRCRQSYSSRRYRCALWRWRTCREHLVKLGLKVLGQRDRVGIEPVIIIASEPGRRDISGPHEDETPVYDEEFIMHNMELIADL